MLRTKEVGNYIVAYLKGRLDVHISGEIEKDLMLLSEKNPESDFGRVVPAIHGAAEGVLSAPLGRHPLHRPYKDARPLD